MTDAKLSTRAARLLPHLDPMRGIRVNALQEILGDEDHSRISFGLLELRRAELAVKDLEWEHAPEGEDYIASEVGDPGPWRLTARGVEMKARLLEERAEAREAASGDYGSVVADLRRRLAEGEET